MKFDDSQANFDSRLLHDGVWLFVGGDFFPSLVCTAVASACVSMDRSTWGTPRSTGSGNDRNRRGSTDIATTARGGDRGPSGGRFRFASRDRRRAGNEASNASPRAAPRTPTRAPSPRQGTAAAGSADASHTTRQAGRSAAGSGDAARNWRSPVRGSPALTGGAGSGTPGAASGGSRPPGGGRRWRRGGGHNDAGPPPSQPQSQAQPAAAVATGAGVAMSGVAGSGRARLAASLRQQDRATWLAQLARLQPSRNGRRAAMSREELASVVAAVGKVLFPSPSITRHECADMVAELCGAVDPSDRPLAGQVFALIIKLARHVPVRTRVVPCCWRVCCVATVAFTALWVWLVGCRYR